MIAIIAWIAFAFLIVLGIGLLFFGYWIITRDPSQPKRNKK